MQKLIVLFIRLIAFAFTALIAACAGMQGAGPHRGTHGGVMRFPNAPPQIALLLPLQGRLGGSGRAIRNGFLAAYYYAKKNYKHSANIHVFDTSTSNIITLYQRAIAKGAQVVVGPLSKHNVARLARRGRLPVPTLALNTLPHTSAANLYQFGLSPHDEALQVANTVYQNGQTRALVIAPENHWGQGIANTFRQRWQQLGGTVKASLAYSPHHDLAKTLRTLLQVDKSQARTQKLQRILTEKVRATETRRKDINMIFLVATPHKARQIVPLLKYYYAGNLPIYTTSIINTQPPAGHKNYDLDGIHFPDMPWMLNALSGQLATIQTYVHTLWPHTYQRYPRLYALGVDAYLIATYGPRRTINGATGQLTLGGNQTIHRHLRWARMKNGQVTY